MAEETPSSSTTTAAVVEHSTNMLDSEPLSGSKIPSEFIPGVMIKPEPISPPASPIRHPGPAAPIPGRFAPGRGTRRGDEPVDLATYQFGLYSYYAEGNTRGQYDSPHFDPHYYGDVKDPTLLDRARDYFRNLGREQPEEEGEVRLRGEGGSHRPMYERRSGSGKRRRIEISVRRVHLGEELRELLSERYPSLKEQRWSEVVEQRQCGRSGPGRPHSVAWIIEEEGPSVKTEPGEEEEEEAEEEAYMIEEPQRTPPVKKKRRKKRKKGKRVIPISVKQEIFEAPDTVTTPVDIAENTNSVNSPPLAPPPETVLQTPIAPDNAPTPAEEGEVKVKEEPIDSEQMIEIFKKRVKKLRRLGVTPLVKEEPVEFEDIPVPESGFPGAGMSIKEEPLEAGSALLRFEPKARVRSTIRPKFVYSRRIRQGRRKSAPPRFHDFQEFDTAAELTGPFSPPKVSWSAAAPPRAASPEEEDEEGEESDPEVTSAIDSLIESANIKTLEDTEIMYKLFKYALESNTDPTANVFNIVLEMFRKTKVASSETTATPAQASAKERVAKSRGKEVVKVPFPMSDHEIYSQGEKDEPPPPPPPSRSKAVPSPSPAPVEERTPEEAMEVETEEREEENPPPNSQQPEETVEEEEEQQGEQQGEQDSSFGSDKRPSSTTSNLNDAEKLFHEVLQPSSLALEGAPGYLDQGGHFFSNLEDLIKVPLHSNNNLIRPKPSYGRMSYHESSSEQAPAADLPAAGAGSKDHTAAAAAEWHNWRVRGHPESFEHFQPWQMEEQPGGGWSPQHSIYDSYFEPPASSSTSFEDKEIRRGFSEGPSSWIDGRGGRVLRIAVEHRTVQTQYPHNSDCLAVEVTPPVTSYIVQRQDSVRPVASQTTLSYASSHWNGLAPVNSVLVEPLLSARKASRSHGSGYARLATQHRKILTQFPANNTVYPAFEPSLPFLAYPRPNRAPRDAAVQTEPTHGSTARRLRPVLVEPVPNITPIGENVRTMRSTDAYGRLMEQIRTSNDPSFDRFMNSQIPPNGVASKYNKYSCYAPQGRMMELPLTVKKNYPKKGGGGAGGGLGKGKRPGMTYKEVVPKPIPPVHSNQGLTPYQISVKIRKIGQVENIIGRLSTMKKIKKKGGKDEGNG